MMTCEQFKTWLAASNTDDRQSTQTAHQHTETCESCRQLLAVDTHLEMRMQEAFQTVDPPPGLTARIRRKVQPQPEPRQRWLGKIVMPALAMSAVLILLLINPFNGRLDSMDDLRSFAVANHMDAGVSMDFTAAQVQDVVGWFKERLDFAVALPDLDKLGLTLLGGRKCFLDKKAAAYLFCKSKGQKASLFLVEPDDLRIQVHPDQTYFIQGNGQTVRIWLEGGVVCVLVQDNGSPDSPQPFVLGHNATPSGK